jgi:small-conductance mechanosensitive channel
MQTGVTELDVYQDAHRSRDLVIGFVAAGVTTGLLLLFPQLQGLFKNQNAALVRLLILVLAGGSGVLAIWMGMTAAFAGLEKSQTVVAWRNLLSWTLYILLVVMLATAAGINLSALLLAGGVVSVIAAIAAQNTLSNFFAGLMLLVARPYRIGDSVYLRSGNFGGAQYEGLIVDIGSLYTTLSSAGELFRIPNSVVLGSVVVADHKPLRADVALQLPSGVSLVQFEAKVRSRLGLQPGAQLLLLAERYSRQEGEAQIGVRLQIKAREWLSAEEVMSAIDAAARELSDQEPKPRLVDASDAGPS